MSAWPFSFDTERLTVGRWPQVRADQAGIPTGPTAEAAAVARVLTAATTAELPLPWQGDYDEARARGWLAACDRSGTIVRFAAEQATATAVGLLILFPQGSPGQGVDLQVGYVLAEEAWGRGLGGELLAGLVETCRADARVASLCGGVSTSNARSRHILAKTGFVERETNSAGDVVSVELILRT